jgi:ABC-type branched-subunit amino acid transport system ATPase component/ABC-type branched-subunit amino acid transport system permease subunit
VSGFDITGPIVLLGTLTGLGYALLAVGLVLTYRSSRVINFAHGAVGLFVAGLFAVVVGRYDVPYLLGFPAALLCGALVGAALESLIVRRLAAAPRVLVMVATLGVGEALLLLSLSFNSGGLGGRTFPQPTLFPSFEVGPLFIPPALTALLILTPVLLVALGLFLVRSRYGVAMRGAASNPDAATLAGAAPQYMSMLAWALAGLVATFSALLILPSRGAVTPESLGPGFLLRGLAAAAVARFANLPLAFVVGVGLGILEAVLATNPGATGGFEVAVFVVVFIGVGLQSRARRGRVAEDRWADLAPAPPLPEVYRRLPLIRWAPAVLVAVCALVAALLPSWISNQNAFVLAVVLGFAIVAISVSLLTGIGGQLSLGQVAFGAIGALAAVVVARETGSILLALLCGAVAGGLAAGVVGLPALRVRGQLLGVATLAFTLMASGWLLRQEWAFDRTGVSAPPRQVLGIELTTSRAYYYVALVAFVVALAVAALVRRSRFGSRLRAVRDNEDAARALRIPATRVKLGSYLVAGMLAGLGGSVIGFASTQISAALFTPRGSVDAVSVAVIGGLGGFLGPLLGSLYLIGIPRLFDLGLTPLAALNAGWLILILERPRGLSALLGRVRDGYYGAVARLAGLDPPGAGPAGTPAEAAPVPQPARPVAAPAPAPASTSAPAGGADLLVVQGLSKRFGGTRAVDGVSFSVAPGDRLGIIGPNGAGKTTLFEMVSGFVAPDAGTVLFDGVDVSAYSPERRSRAGLVRSFQNARLFPTMTVAETVALAASANPDRPDPAEFLNAFGLGPRAAQPLSAMPTGTRRLVELAAGLALHPRVLLLDEPSAGIAQSETRELAAVLERIGETHGVTLVIIEHDVPLLAEVCNRMLALEVGAVIAQGTPAEVTTHPDVIRSYLGERHARRGPTAGTGVEPGAESGGQTGRHTGAESGGQTGAESGG